MKYVIFVLVVLLSPLVYAQSQDTDPYQLSVEPRPLTEHEKNMVIEAAKEQFTQFWGSKLAATAQFRFPDYSGDEFGSYCGLISVDDNQGFTPFTVMFKKGNEIVVVMLTSAKAADYEDIDSMYQKCQRMGYTNLRALSQEK